MQKSIFKRIISMSVALSLSLSMCLCTNSFVYADTPQESFSIVNSYSNNSFSANKYYYDQLSAAQKAIYKQLNDSCQNFMNSTVNHSTAVFDVVRFPALSENEVAQTFWTFWYSNPQYHFLATPLMFRTDCIALVTYDYYRNNSTDTVTNIRSTINNRFDSASSELISSLGSLKGDVEKEKAIINTIKKIKSSDIAESKSVYGALLGNGCNSIGYAMTMNYFCNLANLPCITLVNDNNAAWNMVKLNGDWYLVDVSSYIKTGNEAWINNNSAGLAALDPSGGHIVSSNNAMFKGITLPECTKTNPKDQTQTQAKPNPPSFAVKGVFGGRNVTFNCTTPGATIYYSTENRSDLKLTDPHVNPGETVLFTAYYGTVYARAYYNGQWSNAARLILKIPKVNTPTITKLDNGKYKIRTTTPSCIVYYTIDGTTPSATNYKGKFWTSHDVYIPAGKTVKAIAVRNCFSDSEVTTAKT